MISGIGVRGFYRKIGYHVGGRGGFMIKDIHRSLAERLWLPQLLNIGLVLLIIWSLYYTQQSNE